MSSNAAEKNLNANIQSQRFMNLDMYLDNTEGVGGGGVGSYEGTESCCKLHIHSVLYKIQK